MRMHCTLAPCIYGFKCAIVSLLSFYSFDQHAKIDLPAMVDYALSVSRQDKLYYVGHSQGTTMGFAGFSSNKTLASKIIEFYALAPVVYVENCKGAFSYIADVYKPLEVCNCLW